MGAFTGTLNKNEIYSALYNMIISQDIFSDRLNVSEGLVGKAKSNAGLYGDTKLYYAYDVANTTEWNGDEEASNLLALNRPKAPECQTITINKFRMVWITLDYYLSKRAWSDEGVFGEFTAQMAGLLAKTKKIHEYTTYNAFVGTAEQEKETVSIPSTTTNEDEVKLIAQKIHNLKVDLADLSRTFNAYGQATIFDKVQIKIIWNSAFLSKMTLVDLPAIFHKEGLIDEGDEMRFSYFGTVNTSAKAGDGSTVRYLTETVIDESKGTSLFAGELVPKGITATAGNSYTVDDTIICKIFVKLPPMLSAFEAGTEFTNARSLTINRYLIWGYNTLELLKAYPFITLRKTA